MDQSHAILVLYEVGLLIVISSMVSDFFKHIRLPGIIGAILVGLFIGGPGGLGFITDLTVINILAALVAKCKSAKKTCLNNSRKKKSVYIKKKTTTAPITPWIWISALLN